MPCSFLGLETYIRLHDKHPVTSLPEQTEDINIEAELISHLIYIEQVEREGQRPKFKDLTQYMEPSNMVRLLKLMPWYFDHEVPLS